MSTNDNWLRTTIGRIADRISGHHGRARMASEQQAMMTKIETKIDTLAQTIETALAGPQADLVNIRKTLGLSYIDQFGRRDHYADPRCIAHAPGQVYSQNNEDGIISEIFSRIGTDSRQFIEIAAGDGIENTTRLLLETGWSGVWVEGGAAEASAIRNVAQKPLADGSLVLIDQMIDADNIETALLTKISASPDYISVDIDYNTSHIWRKLMPLRPRLFCIEYNAHYPPGIAYETPYRADGAWAGDTRFGASLKALEDIGRAHDYSLVGCDIFGVNAFFVRNDLCSQDLFLAPFTAEYHYEPPRFSAVQMRGHGRRGPIE